MGRSHRAFTLIECILVIAIIAVLAAVVYVLMGGAREKARQTVCVSNLRQIGQAVVLYRGDYEGAGPSGSEPANVLVALGVPPKGSILFETGYLPDTERELAHCPDDPLVDKLDGRVFSYGWCARTPPTLPRQILRRWWKRYDETAEQIPVAIDLNHWEQYYQRSNVPLEERADDMFWLILRLNGSVEQKRERMPRDGACAL